MTTEQLRELDAWIAENVFHLGATVGLMKRGLFYKPEARGYTSIASEAGKFTLEEAKKHECVRGEEDDVTIVRWYTPHYTCDTGEALKVLDVLRRNHVVLITSTAERVMIGSVTIRSFCGGKKGYAVPDNSVVAETLSIAICLFAKQQFFK